MTCRSDNVEDRRNSSGGPSMGGPGFRLPSGRRADFTDNRAGCRLPMALI
ncbi:neutral zinc metallopeptidase [Escherichia coli]